MSCLDRHPNEPEHGNEDRVCSQCETLPAETDGICERCRLFAEYRELKEAPIEV